MYQIQKLNIYNPDKESATNQTTIANSTPGPHSYLACQTLDLLLSRLLGQPPITQAWIEKTVVTRVWISSLSTHVQDHPSKLGNLFDDIAHTNGTRLGLEATHASQSVSCARHSLFHRKHCFDISIVDMESSHCVTASSERGQSC
jgi:nucleoside phosphorylase